MRLHFEAIEPPSHLQIGVIFVERPADYVLLKGQVMEAAAFEFVVELFLAIGTGVEVMLIDDILVFVLQHAKQLVVHVAAPQ